jgi:hypothetical protein
MPAAISRAEPNPHPPPPTTPPPRTPRHAASLRSRNWPISNSRDWPAIIPAGRQFAHGSWFELLTDADTYRRSRRRPDDRL